MLSTRARIPLILSILSAAAALAGCGGGGSTPRTPGLLTASRVSGTVQAPPGISVSALRIATSRGAGTIDGAGGFAVPAFSGGRQLAIVSTHAGAPLLMGWVDAAHPTISARSTAECLAYIVSGAFALPPEGQVQALELIGSMTELDAVADAISTSLRANPQSLSVRNDAVATALRNVLTAINGGRPPKPLAVAADPSRSIKFDPPNAVQGGVQFKFGEGRNSVQFTNTRRRLTHVRICRTAWVDKDGVEHPSNDTLTSYELSGTKGLNGVIGTFGDILGGNLAFTPVDGPTTELPLEDEAKSANYRIAIVGPGVWAGNPSVDPQDKISLRKTCITWLVRDLFIPLLLNIICPIGTYSGAQGMADAVSKSDVIQDIMGLASGSPDMVAAIEDKGAVTTAANLLLGMLVGSIQGQKLLITLGNDISVLAGGAPGQAGGAVTAGAQLLNALNVTGIILNSADLANAAKDVLISEKQVVWNVEVIPAKVVISPVAPQIAMSKTKRVTVTIPEISVGGVPSIPVAYQWITTGQFTTLKDDVHGASTTFSSSSNWVDIVANDTKEGEDKITCKIYTLDGQKHDYFGKVETTAKVVPPQYILANADGGGLMTDDDINVFLNDVPIYVDHDELWYTQVPPIQFSAKKGDRLRIEVSDHGGSWGSGPFWLTDPDGKRYEIHGVVGSWGPLPEGPSKIVFNWTYTFP